MGWWDYFGFDWQRTKRILYHVVVCGLIGGTLAGAAHLVVLNLLRIHYFKRAAGGVPPALAG